MTTTTIDPQQDVMTMINVFTVEPEHQQELTDVLAEATTFMLELPGFVSANLHRSLDGARVINYVQWRSRADYDAMQADPRARPHMRQAAGLASFDPIICEVAHVFHA